MKAMNNGIGTLKVSPNIPFDLLREWTNNFSLKIGGGGFGHVYQGVCAAGRFAVKKVSPDLLLTSVDDMEEVMKCVVKEIDVLQAFHHPNIVKLMGFHMPLQPALSRITISQLCLVYELAARGSLSDVLKQTDEESKRDFDSKRRVRLLAKVASAINHMHCHLEGQPAYHRDIKASNITLDSDYNPRLIDCGIAQFVGDDMNTKSISRTTTGKLSCTLAYACPVYVSSSKYEARCDIFSFGLVMAEVLTGMLQGTNGVFSQQTIDDITPDPLAGAWPGDSFEQLKELATNCVEFRINRRPADMLTVMRKLDTVVNTYCQPTIEERRLAEEITKARKELDGMKILGEVQSMSMISCSVCCDRVRESDGIKCSNVDEECQHFSCKKCFGGYASILLHIILYITYT